MADYPVPKNGVAYIFYAGLPSQANTLIFQANPTIAAGDFKVSIDGGALANLTTLPTVTPAAGKMVKFSLSAAEMTGDNITVVCSDAAGAEWCDQVFNLQTSARGVADLAFPATSGRSMVVDAAGLVDANAVKLGPTGAGTAQTARDLGTSVLLSSGTGTGQLDFTSGVVKANLAQILGTALTETAGLLAGGFKKFFNIATPAATMDHGVLVDTATNLTTNNDKTGYGLSGAAVQAIWDALTSALTTANSIGKRLVDFVTTLVYAAPPAAAPTAAANAAALLATALTQHDVSALTTNTVEDALSAARAQGAGAWTIVGTTLTLKNPDGTTFRTLTLNSSTAPTSRT